MVSNSVEEVGDEVVAAMCDPYTVEECNLIASPLFWHLSSTDPELLIMGDDGSS